MNIMNKLIEKSSSIAILFAVITVFVIILKYLENLYLENFSTLKEAGSIQKANNELKLAKKKLEDKCEKEKQEILKKRIIRLYSKCQGARRRLRKTTNPRSCRRIARYCRRNKSSRKKLLNKLNKFRPYNALVSPGTKAGQFL